jgi:hypothetical protein
MADMRREGVMAEFVVLFFSAVWGGIVLIAFAGAGSAGKG